MRKIIIGNWKMNPTTPKEALRIFSVIHRETKSIKNIDVVFAPPFVFLHLLKGAKIGAQDVFWEKVGAYTGEVSAVELKALGVTHVIVGHSERRAMCETDEIVHKKLEAVLGAGMKAVLCIGELERKKDEAS